MIRRIVRPMTAKDATVSWRTDPLALLDTVVAGIGGERRAGQHELTAAVADAMARGHHLVAEAPTGSGKSLAYLVPAVASGLKVVVATSTIALQRQLVGKDLPALAEHGGIKFSYALLKGRVELPVPRQAARRRSHRMRCSKCRSDPTSAASTPACGSSPNDPTPATGPSSSTRSTRPRGPRSAARASSARASPSAPTAPSASPSGPATARTRCPCSS